MSAALNIVATRPPEHAAWLPWRREVASIVTGYGMGPNLAHVSEDHWVAAFETGAEPFQAVLEEASQLD